LFTATQGGVPYGEIQENVLPIQLKFADLTSPSFEKCLYPGFIVSVFSGYFTPPIGGVKLLILLNIKNNKIRIGAA